MKITVMEDIENFRCYYHEHVQEVVESIIGYGTQHFASTLIVRRLKVLDEILKKWNRNEEPTQVDQGIVSELFFEHLTDNIKISVCFENYAKAQLIKHGYLVHEIKDKLKTLRENQKKMPVRVEEFKAAIQIENGQYFSDGLSSRTLNYNRLLNEPSYNIVIGYPDSILSTLNMINAERNKLHLLQELNMSLSDFGVLRIQELWNFIETHTPFILPFESTVRLH